MGAEPNRRRRWPSPGHCKGPIPNADNAFRSSFLDWPTRKETSLACARRTFVGTRVPPAALLALLSSDARYGFRDRHRDVSASVDGPPGHKTRLRSSYPIWKKVYFATLSESNFALPSRPPPSSKLLFSSPTRRPASWPWSFVCVCRLRAGLACGRGRAADRSGRGDIPICHPLKDIRSYGYVCFLYHPPRTACNFSQPSEGVRSRFKVLAHSTG